MSIDEQIEEKACEAVIAIRTIPRPNERTRICKKIIEIAAYIGGFDIRFEPPDDDSPA